MYASLGPDGLKTYVAQILWRLVVLKKCLVIRTIDHEYHIYMSTLLKEQGAQRDFLKTKEMRCFCDLP